MPVERILYVVFLGSSIGLSTRPPHVIQKARAKTTNGPQRNNGPTNKFEVRNWKVTSKIEEVELISPVLVSTALGGVNC